MGISNFALPVSNVDQIRRFDTKQHAWAKQNGIKLNGHDYIINNASGDWAAVSVWLRMIDFIWPRASEIKSAFREKSRLYSDAATQDSVCEHDKSSVLDLSLAKGTAAKRKENFERCLADIKQLASPVARLESVAKLASEVNRLPRPAEGERSGYETIHSKFVEAHWDIVTEACGLTGEARLNLLMQMCDLGATQHLVYDLEGNPLPWTYAKPRFDHLLAASDRLLPKERLVFLQRLAKETEHLHKNHRHTAMKDIEPKFIAAHQGVVDEVCKLEGKARLILLMKMCDLRATQHIGYDEMGLSFICRYPGARFDALLSASDHLENPDERLMLLQRLNQEIEHLPQSRRELAKGLIGEKIAQAQMLLFNARLSAIDKLGAAHQWVELQKLRQEIRHLLPPNRQGEARATINIRRTTAHRQMSHRHRPHAA